VTRPVWVVMTLEGKGGRTANPDEDGTPLKTEASLQPSLLRCMQGGRRRPWSYPETSSLGVRLSMPATYSAAQQLRLGQLGTQIRILAPLNTCHVSSPSPHLLLVLPKPHPRAWCCSLRRAQRLHHVVRIIAGSQQHPIALDATHVARPAGDSRGQGGGAQPDKKRRARNASPKCCN
jgi:hypothetical protein